MAEAQPETDDSKTSEDSDESDSSGDRDSEISATKNDHEAGTSQEEENFLRYSLLAHIAVDAVRIWFDTIVPPRKLEKHLKRHKKKAFKNCSAEQKDVLFPENPVTSEKFDITLFYKIIRNTTDVKKPTKGWGEEPDPSDIEPADDLERVRICRNFLCHCPPSVTDGNFEKKWKELSEVIKRLSKGQLNGKVDSLKDKILDWSTRSSLRLDLVALRERVRDVEKSVAHHIPQNLKDKREKLTESVIPPNVRGKTKKRKSEESLQDLQKSVLREDRERIVLQKELIQLQKEKVTLEIQKLQMELSAKLHENEI